MKSISTSTQWKKLRNKTYREEFVATQARRAIPFQIRALMRKRKISQKELADKAGLTQGVISRAANPSYGKLALNTIIRVAAGFDMAFVGMFVPFSKLVDFYDKLSEEYLGDVQTFTEEDAEVSAFDHDPDSIAVTFKARVLEWNHQLGTLQNQKAAKAIGETNGQLPFGPKEVWPIRKGTDSAATINPAEALIEKSQREAFVEVPSELEGQQEPERREPLAIGF